MMISVFSIPLSAVAEEISPRLLGIYGDNMLFAQKKDIVLAGYAPVGSKIHASLIKGGETLATGFGSADSTGLFTVVLDGMNGGYDEYSIELYYNSQTFATLKNVVFGELWLASGQSNMQYGMIQSVKGYDVVTNDAGDDNIRVLEVPAYPEYNGSGSNIPFSAQEDIKGTYWYRASDNSRLGGCSAVAYFFAEKLRAELDMPIGILNASLGGSSIYTWLSREDIDATPAVKDFLTKEKKYITEGKWNSTTPDPHQNMTSNFNKKIYPLRHLTPCGVIWYQGETNISAPNEYKDAFNLMQSSYSKLFGYQDTLIPYVFTQLASFHYGNDENAMNLVGNFNIMLSELQNQEKSSRAVTSIYDVDLEWDTNKIAPNLGYVGAIHPITKAPVGEKMAFAALGLVYGKRESYTAPFVKSVNIADGKVEISFESVGDGLVIKPLGNDAQDLPVETPLYGFTVAGKNGFYIEAKAEIKNSDTIVVWHDSIKEPASAAYAYSEANLYSNLFASENGEPTLGVSAFITKRLDGARYTQDRYWTTCDIAELWHPFTDPKFLPAFKVNSGNAEAAIDFGVKKSGSGSLKVDYKNSETVSISPVLKEDGKSLPSISKQYNEYDSVTISVMNTSDKPLKFEGFRFYLNSKLWASPAADIASIPSDGEWHTIKLDLNKLKCNIGFSLGRYMLVNVEDIELVFSGGAAPGTFYIDEIDFSAANDTKIPQLTRTINSIMAKVILFFINLFD